MKLRLKNNPTITFESHTFNPVGLSEVLTGDDSIRIAELEVLIDGVWKDMQQAFKDSDILPDNYNRHFAPPASSKAKARGYND